MKCLSVATSSILPRGPWPSLGKQGKWCLSDHGSQQITGLLPRQCIYRICLYFCIWDSIDNTQVGKGEQTSNTSWTGQTSCCSICSVLFFIQLNKIKKHKEQNSNLNVTFVLIFGLDTSNISILSLYFQYLSYFYQIILFRHCIEELLTVLFSHSPIAILVFHINIIIWPIMRWDWETVWWDWVCPRPESHGRFRFSVMLRWIILLVLIKVSCIIYPQHNYISSIFPIIPTIGGNYSWGFWDLWSSLAWS